MDLVVRFVCTRPSSLCACDATAEAVTREALGIGCVRRKRLMVIEALPTCKSWGTGQSMGAVFGELSQFLPGGGNNPYATQFPDAYTS